MTLPPIGEFNPMMLDNRAREVAELNELAALSARLRTAIQYSLAQSLAGYFPPPEEPPPELRALLERLDKALSEQPDKV
jgi:hypothetical protein